VAADQSSLTRSVAEGRADPQVAKRFNLRCRLLGEDVSLNTLTMVGMRRLDNLQALVKMALEEGVPGDLVETGCAKGGACIFMRACLLAYADTQRRVICCDTFSGKVQAKGAPPLLALLLQPLYYFLWSLAFIPSEPFQAWLYGRVMKLQHAFPVDPEHTSRDTIRSFIFYLRHHHRFATPPVPTTGTSIAHVKSHFARLGLLDEQVVFVPGFFADSLPTAPIEQIAVLRLDGDLYSSTLDALNELYPKLAPGGFCVVDDYYSFEECRQAIHEYRDQHGITQPLVRIDNMSVYWRAPVEATGSAPRVKGRRATSPKVGRGGRVK